MALPDKLRDEVTANADEDRLDERRTVLASLISELALKTKHSVGNSILWTNLKDVCDAEAAVAKFIDDKITPLAARDTDAYRENAQLSEAVTAAVEFATALDRWPAGMAALAQKQSGLEGALKSLVKSDLKNFMAAAGNFEAAHVHGLGALLWMRTGILEVDLSSSIIPSAECAVFVRLMPTRITTLHLADTDFCYRGKDLRPHEAICSYLATAECGLHDVNLARNALGNDAGEMLANAIAENTSLTTFVRELEDFRPTRTPTFCVHGMTRPVCRAACVFAQDTSGNNFSGEVAEAYAESVVAHTKLEEFGSMPLTNLRNNRTHQDPDYSEHEPKAVEAHVLAALLPAAWSVAGVTLDGSTLPVRKFRGGKPSDVEASALRAKAVEQASLTLLHAPETPSQADAVGGDDEEEEEEGVSQPAAISALQDLNDDQPEAEIDLEKSNLGVASAVVMSSLIASNSTLLNLNLTYNKLGVEGAIALARGLKTNHCLAILSLAWNRLLPDGVAAIAASLHGNKSLTSLNLACNEICGVNSFSQGTYRSEGVAAIAEALTKCDLQTLDVSNNALVGVVGMSGRTMGTYNAVALQNLADGLAGSKVESLVLDGNQIGADGMGTLASALAHHTIFKSLFFADCNLTNGGTEFHGISALVDALKKQPEIKVLNLDGCGLSAAGTKLLCSWLHVQANATASFEHLHLERASNMIETDDEKALREACGEDVMLHLERGRPQYQAGLDKSAGMLRNEIKRRTDVAAAAAALPKASGKSATTDDLGLVPSPPSGGRKAGGGRHGKRRGSTGSV